jgi:preprotein translocase subunit YajC
MNPGGAGGQGGGSMISMLVFFGVIILIMYLLIIRPQQKRQKEHQKMLTELKPGQRVVTTAGIHGIIREAHEKYFILEIADNVKVKFERPAVAAKASE